MNNCIKKYLLVLLGKMFKVIGVYNCVEADFSMRTMKLFNSWVSYAKTRYDFEYDSFEVFLGQNAVLAKRFGYLKFSQWLSSVYKGIDWARITTYNWKDLWVIAFQSSDVNISTYLKWYSTIAKSDIYKQYFSVVDALYFQYCNYASDFKYYTSTALS